LNYQILVVDDEDDIASTLELALTMEGHEVKIAYNGKEALELLSTEPRPQLIISDLMMPVMDGYDLSQEINKVDELRKIPLIITSAGKIDTARIKCDYTFLRKPFSLDELYDSIKKATQV
jgi:CheY-like chemotaxis protein